MKLAPDWLKGLWHRHPLVVMAVFAVVAAAVIIALVWPVTDLLAAHDVGLITGTDRAARLQTARQGVRTQLLTLGAGVFAFGALVYTARNFTLSRNTFKATETRVLNERFIAIAAQLGDDQAAVRLAGVHAMAGLADDWNENRQACVDVLCACLRLPYKSYKGPKASPDELHAFQGDREVRWTVMRVIAEHLRDPGVKKQVAPESWQRLNFNLSGVVFDGGGFSYARFSAGNGDSGATIDSGATVDFGRAEFSTSDKVSFRHVDFSGGIVKFRHAKFSGGPVEFHDAKFSDGVVNFYDAEFSGGTVDFEGAQFSGGEVSFHDAKFSDGVVSFDDAEFSGGTVRFDGAAFSGCKVSFDGAKFSGALVDFRGAKSSGCALDFSHVAVWERPPEFGEDPPPAWITLPPKDAGQP